MKLKLPNDKVINLDSNLDYEERLKVVNDILSDWKNYFDDTWQLNKTKVCLEILSNYLCFVKSEEDKNKEDKYVMSTTKMKKMRRGDNRNSNFSELPKEHQKLLGLVDISDESGE